MTTTTTNTGAFETVTIKVGVMPGRITEVAVTKGSSVKEVLALVELNEAGYEVRVNGVTGTIDTALETDGTVLLVKQIKGNAQVKIGVMPGKITEFTLAEGVTIKEALEIAELNATGYEVRYNGITSSQDATVDVDGTILLVKQIKGNGNFKVGVMPGRINEFAVNDGSTVKELLGLAELDERGYEIRVNGVASTVDTVLSGDGTVLLVKQIKGNR